MKRRKELKCSLRRLQLYKNVLLVRFSSVGLFSHAHIQYFNNQ